MLSINHLYKNFGNYPVLQDIHASLDKGKTVAIVGSNGSGKTTLMKCILGLCQSTQGNISFTIENTEKKISDYKQHIGYMPQSPSFPPNMKVKDIFLLLQAIRKQKAIDTELMDQFSLHNMENKIIQTLSGGMKQKVSAAIAFLFAPEILVLDEPTTGLDPIAAKIFKQKIKKEAPYKLIFISSHILSDLDELIDKIIYIQEGKILFYDTVSHLQQITHYNKISDIIVSKLTS